MTVLYINIMQNECICALVLCSGIGAEITERWDFFPCLVGVALGDAEYGESLKKMVLLPWLTLTVNLTQPESVGISTE